MLSVQTGSHASEQYPLFTADDVRLLAAVGFLAGKSGCVAPAIRIFQAIIKLRPDADFPFIGLSIAYMSVGMNAEAVQVLAERQCPDAKASDPIDLWRSLAFHVAGDRSSAAASLQRYAMGSPDDTQQALVQRLNRELGLRASAPDWPSPAIVSDQEIMS
jgi:hypothetical protein